MSTPENWCQPDQNPSPEPNPGSCGQIGFGSLCEQGWQPLLITGMLRDMMVRHFAEPLRLKSDDLRRYVWREDERTGILIESVYRWRGALVQKRPALLIKRNAYRSQRHSISDLAGRDEKGNESFSVLWIGSHTVFCIHGTGASTDILTTEVQKHLTQNAPAVREYLGLRKFVVTEVGAISEVEESTENYVSPITIGWAYEEHWKLQVEALPIRRIPLSFLVDDGPHETAALIEYWCRRRKQVPYRDVRRLGTHGPGIYDQY